MLTDEQKTKYEADLAEELTRLGLTGTEDTPKERHQVRRAKEQLLREYMPMRDVKHLVRDGTY